MSLQLGTFRGRPVRVPVRFILIAAFALVAGLLAIGVTVSARDASQFVDVSRDALQTNAAVLELEQTLSAIRDAETGQRGYLLTGDTTYLGPYREGSAAVMEHLATLLALTASPDYPGQLDRGDIGAIQRLIQAKQGEMQRTIEVYSSGQSARALDMVRTDVGKSAMDTLRTLIGDLERREIQDLRQSTAAWHAAVRGNYTAVVTLAVLGLMFLAALLYGTARVVAERRAQAAMLERRVRERTAELAEEHARAIEASERAEEAAMQAEEEAARAEEETTRAEDEAARAEHHRAAAAESAARLGQLLEQTTAGYMAFDRQWRLTYFNRQALQIAPATGLTGEQMLGRTLLELWPGARGTRMFEAHERVMRDRTSATVEQFLPPYERWFRAHIYPVDDGIGVLFDDITEAKAADALRAESEDRFRTLAESLPVMIWVADAEKHCTYLNAGWLRFTGRAPDEELGFGWLDGVHPEDAVTCRATFEEAFEARRPFTMEFRLRRHDGEYRWIRDEGIPRYAGEGIFAGYVGACLDITTMRETNRRLGQMERLESVGRLAGGVAHETNNQMTVVLGASSFLLKHPELPPAVRDDILQIQRAAERAASISGQLLAYSRRQMLRPQVVDLNAIVTGIQPVLRRALEDTNTLSLHLDTMVGPIMADPGQVEQLLLNLTLNARDAMAGGGRLTIATERVTLTATDGDRRPGVKVRPGPYARLTVTDTGHGMDQHTLGRVFEPFFTTKPVGQGTGLGLATVYGIVKQSQGYVWVYSEPGQGTTFKIDLPLADSDAAPIRPARPSRPHQSNLSEEMILIVEDEALVRTLATRSLEEAGYKVVSAGNGAEALTVLTERQGQVAMVVTDLAMPGVGGRELAERIQEQYPGLPILFMSGFPDYEVVRRGLLAQGRPFLQKPFSPEELVHQVAAVLGTKAPAEPA
jgi:PAS domain S-box-containing protein